jgi:tetratricopeptide (TPR) repeat protein
MINFDQFQTRVRSGNWISVYEMLDEARNGAITNDDIMDEAFWRVVALTRQQRYEEALDFLRKNAKLFNSQSLVQHKIACILIRLGRDQDALNELSKAPVEEEMQRFYALAIDAKFFYYYLLAKNGDPSVKRRLDEIPDDYRHITAGGKFLTKPDIVALLD